MRVPINQSCVVLLEGKGTSYAIIRMSSDFTIIARPMSRESIVQYLRRTHGHGNPEILRAYLDEVPL